MKPHTTLLIAESKFQIPFDLGHTMIRKYNHMGEDIGYTEAQRFQEVLKTEILEILQNPQIDSPVFTYLKKVQGVEESTAERELPMPDENDLKTLIIISEQAQRALGQKDFSRSKELFALASEMDPKNEFFVQQRALATYKSEHPTVTTALWDALQILETLNPSLSADPETLGLTGAVYKRLWEEVRERGHLDKSIQYYERGFYIKRDYYNGINLAFLLNVRAKISTGDEKIADAVQANRVRSQVVEICQGLVDNQFHERSDQYWILATMEEAYFGLQKTEQYMRARELAQKAVVNSWARESTEQQIEKLRELMIR